MAHARMATIFVVLAIANLVGSQTVPALDQKQAEVMQRRQKLLGELQIDSKHFLTALPLSDFLQAVEKQLPPEKKLALRIDKKAFGPAYAEVAATPIVLAPLPKKVSLDAVLRLALSKVKTKVDYRLGHEEFVITTPARALYTAAYDIRDLRSKDFLGSIADVIEPESSKLADGAPMLIINNASIVFEGNAERHAQVADWLATLRRLGGVTVTVKARLYEVDGDFAQKLKNVKRVPLDEERRLFLAGLPSPWDGVYKLLGKQNRILECEEAKVRDGAKTLLLAQHKVIRCLPTPAQVREGKLGPQTILDGIAFSGAIRASAARNSVRIRFTEKVVELLEIQKTKAFAPADDKELDAETAFVKEVTQTQVLDIHDAGSVLVLVQHRPRALVKKNRWWVLSITARIHIEEEDRYFRNAYMEKMVPLVAADVLSNPRLKNLRDFYGSPGDKRVALLDSDAWTWPKKPGPNLPGFELTPVDRKGQRFLGIRIEKYEEAGKDAVPTITVSLSNAGGNANGAVAGRGTVRYTARQDTEDWKVELAENESP